MNQIAVLTKRGDDAVRSLRPGSGLEHFDADAALLHVLLSRLEEQQTNIENQSRYRSPRSTHNNRGINNNDNNNNNRSRNTSSTHPAADSGEGDDPEEDIAAASRTSDGDGDSDRIPNRNLIRLLNAQEGDSAALNVPGMGASPPVRGGGGGGAGSSHQQQQQQQRHQALVSLSVDPTSISSYPIDVRRQVGRLRSEYEIGRATLLRMVKAVSELLGKFHSATNQNKHLEKQLTDLKRSHDEVAKELRTLKLAAKYLGANSTHRRQEIISQQQQQQQQQQQHGNGNNEFDEAWNLESEASSKAVDEQVRSSVEHFKTLVLLHRHSKSIASIVCPTSAHDQEKISTLLNRYEQQQHVASAVNKISPSHANNNNRKQQQQQPNPVTRDTSSTSVFDDDNSNNSNNNNEYNMIISTPTNAIPTIRIHNPTNEQFDFTDQQQFITASPHHRGQNNNNHNNHHYHQQQQNDNNEVINFDGNNANNFNTNDVDDYDSEELQTRIHLQLEKHPDIRRQTRRELIETIKRIDEKNDAARVSGESITQPPQRKKISDVLHAVDNFLAEWGAAGGSDEKNGGAGMERTTNMMMMMRSQKKHHSHHHLQTDGNNQQQQQQALLFFDPYNYSIADRFAIASCRSEQHTMQVDDFTNRVEGITILKRTHHLQPTVSGSSSNAAVGSTGLIKRKSNMSSASATGVADHRQKQQQSSPSSSTTFKRIGFPFSHSTFKHLDAKEFSALSLEEQQEYYFQRQDEFEMCMEESRGERHRTLVKCHPSDRRVISLATMLIEALCANRSPFVVVKSTVPDETVLSRTTMRSHGLGPVWQAGGEATFCVASCPLPPIFSSSIGGDNNNSSSFSSLQQQHQQKTATGGGSPSRILASPHSTALSMMASTPTAAAVGGGLLGSPHGKYNNDATNQTQTLLVGAGNNNNSNLPLDPGEAAKVPGIVAFLSAFCVPLDVTTKYETQAAKAEAARKYLLKENYMRCYASSALPGTVTAALIGPYVDRTRPFFVTANESGGEYVEIFFTRAVVFPTGYSFACCHVSGAPSFPRSWRLEASADSGVTWTLLKRHVDDRTLHHHCPRAAWSIDDPTKTSRKQQQQQQQQQQQKKSDQKEESSAAGSKTNDTSSSSKATAANSSSGGFSRFRICIEGPNSSGTWHINASCIEIYGRVLTLQSTAVVPSLISQEHVPFLNVPQLTPEQDKEIHQQRLSSVQHQMLQNQASSLSAAGGGATSAPSSATAKLLLAQQQLAQKSNPAFESSNSFTNCYAGLGAPPVQFVAATKKEKTTKGKRGSSPTVGKRR